MFDYNAVKNAMGELDEDVLNELLKAVADEGGVHAQEALEACQEGMQIVGDRFETGEYFVADLVFAGEILTNGMSILGSSIGKEAEEKVGRMMLCTVKDDLHDIGKNIVKAILEANGFEVIDLGIDTPVERIVDVAKQEDIHIIALSGVLTLAIDSMKATVDGLIDAGIRDQIKVIIGGNPVTETACRQVGADAWSNSPQKTADICKGWIDA